MGKMVLWKLCHKNNFNVLKTMPILAILELTLRNAKDNMSDYFGFRIFINFRKTTNISSLEPGLSNRH